MKQQEENLKNQQEISQILGISKSQLSKLISSKFHVQPEKVEGNKKYFDYKKIEKLYFEYKNNQSNKSVQQSKRKEKSKTTTKNADSLLISSLQSEVSFLRKQLETKDETIKQKDIQLKENADTVANLAKQLAKLADQSQQLNLIDKPSLVSKNSKETASKHETMPETGNKETKKYKWWSIFKRKQ